MDNKEDKEDYRGEHRNAQDLVNLLSVVLRTAQIHDRNNIAVTVAVEKFLSLLNQMIATARSISLSVIGEYFYLNEVRIRYSLEHLLNFDFLIREFKKRELGNVEFSNALKPEDLQLFLKAFIAAGFSDCRLSGR